MNVGCQLIITEFQSSLILIFGESMRMVKAISPFAGGTSKSKKDPDLTTKNSTWTFKIFLKRTHITNSFRIPGATPKIQKLFDLKVSKNIRTLIGAFN